MSRINVYAYPTEQESYLDSAAAEPTLDGWFNPDRAERFDEGTRWDGNNHVSVHTSGKFDHQILYRTAGGRWVLCRWSQWQGSKTTYEFITDDEAKQWLLIAEEDAAVERYFGELDDEHGPSVGGRPEIGPAFSLRFPEDLLAKVDAAAAVEGISRAEKIRRIVAADLAVA